ncbi:MAG TPA: hypothetical protein VNV35_21045 [Puia sp.]|nr:hypothetical protein [Puia sp.]
MNIKTITLGLSTLFALPGRSQSDSGRCQSDSLYYVHLLDGTTIHSNHVRLVNSLTRGKYLLLDGNRRIPLDSARDFKGWDGIFAVGAIDGYYDAFRLIDEGLRISLYSKCYYETETAWWSPTPEGPITSRENAWFFRKGTDGEVERLTPHNLKIAMADNPASLAELRIAGIIQTHQRNTAAYNTYQQESAAWYANSMNNPNAPMPTLPHYGLSPLFYVGSAMALTGFIPIFNVKKHLFSALDIYNSAP